MKPSEGGYIIRMMCSPSKRLIFALVDALSVLVVEDHELFADALAARLSREPDLRPLWVAYTAERARTLVSIHEPAVVVLDLLLGEESGIDVLEYVSAQAPRSRVVILTAVDSVDDVVPALLLGARAWLPKTVDSDHLVRVIRGVTRGEVWLAPDLLGRVLTELLARTVAPEPDPLATLTPREREVLQCMVDGLGRREIAARLHISDNTVRTHTQNLLGKLEAHSALESVAIALRHGIRASSG